MPATPERITTAISVLADYFASRLHQTDCRPGIACPSFGEYDLVRGNSHREQRIVNGNSAFVGKCEIVDDSSSFIRMAFDRNDAIGMGLQPLSISLEHGLLLRSNVVAIEGEMDVLYILFHCLLLRRSWN